jgi:hypothetical protein
MLNIQKMAKVTKSPRQNLSCNTSLRWQEIQARVKAKGQLEVIDGRRLLG